MCFHSACLRGCGCGIHRSVTDAKDLPALLRRASLRDEAAARTLVEALGPMLQRIIHSHHPLRDEAEDLLQDVFFAIFRSAGKFRGDAPLEHWAARIARCTCIDRLRRRRTRAAEVRWSDLPPAQQDVLAEGRADDPPAVTVGEDAAALLEKLFDQLPPLDAWLLREVELRERTHTEVAAEAGWSAVLLRVRLFRARRRLQAAYEILQSARP